MSGSTSHLVTRVSSVLRTRGLAGLAAFLITRLLRMQSDLLFERKFAPAETSTQVAGGPRVTIINRDNLNLPEVAGLVAQVLGGEGAIYRQELESRGVAFVVCDELDRVLHYSFVQYGGRYKRILAEGNDMPLFTNCFTAPKARGRGLYPDTLRTACDWLAERGYTRAIITCDPGNTPSVRGIERAGFLRVRRIESLILLSRFFIQRVHPTAGRSHLRVSWL